ncbi:MAG: phosphate acetyltransferase, partial [Planctomycetota bacterium]
ARRLLMAKANKIYVSAADPHAGTSVITLGLVSTLGRMVDRIGFFKPVGEGPGDADVAVMKSAFRLRPDPGEMCPLSITEARELMARGEEGPMLDRICAAYDAVRGTSDLVVMEGISHQRSLHLFDLDINATIAARLGAPVVLVAGASAFGSPVTPEELATSVLAAWSEFQEKGCELIGVVVNRVLGDAFAAARDRYLETLEKERITVFGALPNLSYLGLPRLAQIVKVLDAEVLSGREFLANIAAKTYVAAMQPRNFLKWLQGDNILVIAPGDRDDIMVTVALAQMSPQHRRITGLILTGNLRPDPAILELIEAQSGLQFPILAVQTDTFTTAAAVREMDVRIGPGDDDKIYAVASAVQRYVDQSKLWDTLALSGSRPANAGSFLESIITRAQELHKTIVFPEGEEPRTIRAVARLAQGRVVQPILLGNPRKIKAYAEAEGVALEGVRLLDPRTSDRREAYAEKVFAIRRHRRGGMTREYALQWVDESPIHYGTVMVQCGEADGLVAGAIHATGDTMRPAFQIIGVRPEVGVASSAFFMVFKDRVLVYGDCAIIPNPNAQELAGIAIAAARTAQAFGIEPRVAMLSYSTGTSGTGDDVDKVTEATRLVRERDPGLAVDGPMQYDAAIDPEVGQRKQPDSPVAGRATVFIFPDLDAGNIVYKAVQRMSGAQAVGPVLQGLNKPVNDLSRGCSIDDIYYVGAITAIQAGGL